MEKARKEKRGKGAPERNPSNKIRSTMKQQPLISIRQSLEMWLKDFNYTLNKAEALKDAGFYDVAALYIHLAVEKALKAAIAAFKGQEPPKIHALESLYSRVADNLDLSEAEIRFLKRLTDAAYGTRYLDVSLLFPDEIYTKEVVEEYFEKARQIIDKTIEKIRMLDNDSKGVNLRR